jgi:hypothetical protein
MMMRTDFSLFSLILLSVARISFAWSGVSSSHLQIDGCLTKGSRPTDQSLALRSRRYVLKWGASVGLLFPSLALAAGEDPPKSDGLLTASSVADLLRPISTFTIVDKKGVPYMVFGEDAKVTGYFFTTYAEADRILQLAKSSADRAIQEAKEEDPKEKVSINPWSKARISTVPLDSAVTLVSKSGGGNFFQVAPAETDVEDALAVIGKRELAEGKVPLFYYKDFKIEGKSPLYFRKSELEEDFQRFNPDSRQPKLMVTELIAVLSAMVRPGGTDNDLKELAFMPPRESEQKRKECEILGGKEAPFFIGQRIIVL